MSHQDGLGNNGPETTGLSKPDDGDDRMEKKSENVVHTRDGIKLKNLKNSGRLRNSPPDAPFPSMQPVMTCISVRHDLCLLFGRRLKRLEWTCWPFPAMARAYFFRNPSRLVR